MNKSSLIYDNLNYTLSDCGTAFLFGFLEQIGWLFYIVSPSESTKESYDEVVNYELAIFPAIGFLIGLEQFYKFVTRRKNNKLNDIIINQGAGLLFLITRVALLNIIMSIFVFVHTNYRIVDLPKTAYSTWFLSLLLVEFVFYWIHRSLHEVNIFWAAHQFHHEATELDVSTTNRDSIVDLIIYEFFPVPLAIIIPPSVLLVHMQFSLIYQIWLHNEVIQKLGWIEYLINTPAQHRVHHGKNPHCIDKNYGALIMIWDRIFGTHQVDDREKIVFGTTKKPFQTFDSLTLHWYYYYTEVWKKFKEVKGIRNKLAALFYGPGWAPGKPRCGLKEDLLPIEKQEQYERWDPRAPFWQQFYVLIHGMIIAGGLYIVTDHPLIKYSPVNALIMFLYVLFALTSFGCIFDRRPIAPLVESLRCLLYFVFDSYIFSTWLMSAPSKYQIFLQYILLNLRIIHIASIIIWMLICLKWLIYLQYKTYSNNNLTQKYVDELEGEILKKDLEGNTLKKDVQEDNIKSDFHDGHGWKSYQKYIILYVSIVLLSIGYLIFALQLKECQPLAQILESGLKSMINHH